MFVVLYRNDVNTLDGRCSNIVEGALDRRPPLHCCVVLCTSLDNAPNNDMGACISRIIRDYCSLYEFQRPTSRKCHVRWCEHMSVPFTSLL
jgi:hypothetical protein